MTTTAKTCTGCLRMRPLTAYHKAPNTKDGLRTRCKDCLAAYHRRRAARLRQEREQQERTPPTAKGCGRCARTLPASAFGPSTGTVTGLQSYCRPCAVDAVRERRAARRAAA